MPARAGVGIVGSSCIIKLRVERGAAQPEHGMLASVERWSKGLCERKVGPQRRARSHRLLERR